MFMTDGKLIWNPYRDGYFESPYKQIRLLREQNPVHQGINGEWIVFKYDDVKFYLNNPALKTIKPHELFASKNHLLNDSENFNDLAKVAVKWLLFLDPPEHSEFRSAITKIWNTYNLHEYIREVVEETLDDMADQKEIDVVKDFAAIIPARVLGKILGLPPTDYRNLRDWSYHFIRSMEPFESINTLRIYNEKAKNFYLYLQSVIARKEHQPDDTFISRFLTAAKTFEKPLDEKQIISALCFLFFAGIETSVNLFSQSILLLIENPDQALLARESEILPPRAVDELARYITPTQYTMRVTLEDIEIRGKQIKAGEVLTLSLVSANHDSDVFDNPELLDLTRRKNPHLSFGYGLHYCVGAKLAREEMSISIPALLRRYPKAAFHPTKSREWDNLVINRTLKSLPIVLS